MKLSAPIYKLKNQAKALKRSKSITMTEALNRIAKAEGFSSWSLLQAKAKEILPKKKEDILDYLNPGDLMLIGSRFTLQILLQAMQDKRKCFFFSLEYNHKDVASKVANLDESIGQSNSLLKFDFSDDISSEYVISKIKDQLEVGSLIAIDYLQLLDQQRTKPELQVQIEELKAFAIEKKCIIIFISQIDRFFEETDKEQPNLDDVRMPNPVDLDLFNKSMF